MSGEEKRLGEALARLNERLAASPADVDLLEQVARVSLALGDADDAAGFLVRRAEALARAGRIEVALADCRSALQVAPGHAEAGGLADTLERVLELGRGPGLVHFRSPRPEMPATVRARTTLPMDPVRREEEEALDAMDLDEPVLDAAALVTVYEVDGVDVVPVPSDAPDGVALADEGATVDYAPPTLSYLPTAVPAAPLEVEGDQVEAVLRLASGAPSPTPARAPALPMVPLLATLPQSTRDDLARAASHHLFPADAVVCAQGDPCDTLLIIERGRVRRERARPEGIAPAGHLGPDDVMGDLERSLGGPWRFTAVAETEVGVVALDADLVDGLRARFPAFDAVLRSSATRHHGAWLLSLNPMFRGLSPEHRALIAAGLSARHLRAGDRLCAEGAALRYVALVATGSLEVSRGGRAVARLGPGRLAGLGALAHGGRATADVVAGPDGALIYLLEWEEVVELERFGPIRAAFAAATAQRG